MRFLSDGPDIPDRLLEARDKGQVVFLCGAGISMPSGLPNFVQLTGGVFDCLHVSANSPLRKSLMSLEDASKKTSNEMPLGHIFDTLYKDYGKEKVNRIVAKKLSTSVDAPPAKRA